MPAAIAARVHAVIGLSDLARPRPANSFFKKQPCKEAADTAGYTAQNILQNAFTACTDAVNVCSPKQQLDAAELADVLKVCQKFAPPIPPMLTLGPTPKVLPAGAPPWKDAGGAGQKVGLLQFDTFVPGDVSDYLALFGLPDSVFTNLSQVHVNGGATLGPDQSEVLLDIDTVLMGAPEAQVVVYDAPFAGGGSFQALFNRAISDGMTIISNSWTYCEDQTTAADVLSIDAILASAAGAGIAVFNASGDGGSTCLDGSPNTIGVPAGSPHATAVGGTSLTTGPTAVYASETWWNGTSNTPPTGQGGFGVSRFFARPAYQNGFTASATRTIPDIAFSADPANGIILCQASRGGCPTGLSFGGTSIAAPAIAAAAAILNQAVGHNLGNFNLSLYPLAGTTAFHTAASMGSDFAHVGLGSPNLDKLYLALTGQVAGAVSAAQSKVTTVNSLVAANGTSSTAVVVRLRDADGNAISGKTVTLAANPAGNIVITPASAVTTIANGAAVFTISNLMAETVTLTATDTTDGVTVQAQGQVVFGIPLAAGGSIIALTGTAAADGTSTDTITVLLQDSLGRPTPGKLVQLSQTGSSVISGPSPGVTNASGQIQFTVTDTKQEIVTYTAFDVSDGDLRVPGSTTVTFNASGGDNCGSTNFGDPNITAAAGYAITPFATGFVPRNTNFGGIAYGCRGASGLAFDPSGNLYVSDIHSGNIYKFGPAGGVAGAGTLVTTTPLEPGLTGLTFGNNGKLYTAHNATTGNFFTGAVREIDPTNGTVVRTVAASITCASYLATDPVSGDLFVDDACGGSGSDNGSIWRISNLNSGSPTTTVYATTPGTNGGLTFSSGGTLYVLDYLQNGVAKIGGTNTPQPAQLTVLPGLLLPTLNIVAMGAQPNGDAKTLILGTPADASGFPAGIKAFDTTTNPVTTSAILVNNAFANVQIIGPDGCHYASVAVAVYKITNADGSCPLAIGNPALGLSPPTVSPNPAQGTARTFTASFHYTSVPAGTPVLFAVFGANSLQKLVRADANGIATFSYEAVNAGGDTIVASATANSAALTSNPAKVTWVNGLHVTSLDLNLSPTDGIVGTSTTLTASLVDVSLNPVAAVAGASIHLAVGSQSCDAVTDSNGIASCGFILSNAGNFVLSASFAGNASLQPSSAAQGFRVVPVRSCDLDVDGDGSVLPFKDGILFVRYMLGIRGAGLLQGLTLTGVRTEPTSIENFIAAQNYNVDAGSTATQPFVDGIILVRLMLGIPNATLLTGITIPAGAAFTTAAAIRANVNAICGTSF